MHAKRIYAIATVHKTCQFSSKHFIKFIYAVSGLRLLLWVHYQLYNLHIDCSGSPTNNCGHAHATERKQISYIFDMCRTYHITTRWFNTWWSGHLPPERFPTFSLAITTYTHEELLPIEVLHCKIGIFKTFFAPVTSVNFTCDSDPYPAERYRKYENKLATSRFSKVIVWQTYIETNRWRWNYISYHAAAWAVKNINCILCIMHSFHA